MHGEIPISRENLKCIIPLLIIAVFCINTSKEYAHFGREVTLRYQDTSVVYMPHFQRLPHRIAAEFVKNCMSDNIRNNAIFETKLQKLLKIYQNLTFFKFYPEVAQWECFCSHYKKFRWLSFIVTKIWPGQDTNSKSGFWPKLQQFLAKLNFDFLLHNFSLLFTAFF